MSRSHRDYFYKKSKVYYKKQGNRAMRRRTHVLLRVKKFDSLPVSKNEFVDYEWATWRPGYRARSYYYYYKN